MKNNAAFVMRVLTTPQLLAAVLAVMLRAFHPGEVSLFRCLMMILFLTVIPCLAYPVSASIAALRKGGRRTQRNIAVILSVVGYVSGMIFAVAAHGGRTEKIVYGTYLISGIIIALCSFLLRFRVSGHACGTAGPVAALCIFCSPWFLFGVLLLPAVYWSSLRIKRHNPLQLAAGTVTPLVAMLISAIIFR